MLQRRYLFPNVIEMNYQAGRRLGVNVYLIDGGSEFILIDIGFVEAVDEIVELIRRTSAEIPDDVHQAILASLENEKKNSLAANAIKIIDQNIALAKQKSQPICQDTGSILFYVDAPIGYDQITFAETAREAVTLATKKGFLRQNSVDSLTGKNDGTNVGPGAPCQACGSSGRSNMTARHSRL